MDYCFMWQSFITFIVPQPGYVIKNKNKNSDESAVFAKSYINSTDHN